MFSDLRVLSEIYWYLGSAMIGIFCSIAIFASGEKMRAREISDLAWIIFGGAGAFTAIVFAAYSSQLKSLSDSRIAFLNDSSDLLSETRIFFENHCGRPPAYIQDPNEGRLYI